MRFLDSSAQEVIARILVPKGDLLDNNLRELGQGSEGEGAALVAFRRIWL